MSREDIIRLAREAGFDIYCGDYDGVPEVHVDWYCITSSIEDFAALVAAAEREACAKVCERWAGYGIPSSAAAAAAIRSRGEVKP